MIIKFKKLDPEARYPAAMSLGAAGYDLTAVSRHYDIEKGVYTYGTGLAMEIPEGYVGMLYPRSSVFKTGMAMCNSVGVIDSDYRGEISLKFYKVDIGRPYEVGERVGQIMIVPALQTLFVEADELSDTQRGEGGHGSTGK